MRLPCRAAYRLQTMSPKTIPDVVFSGVSFNSLRGRGVLITGGATGIGADMVAEFQLAFVAARAHDDAGARDLDRDGPPAAVGLWGGRDVADLVVRAQVGHHARCQQPQPHLPANRGRLCTARAIQDLERAVEAQMHVQGRSAAASTERDEEVLAMGMCTEQTCTIDASRAFREASLLAAGRDDPVTESIRERRCEPVEGVTFGQRLDCSVGVRCGWVDVRCG